MWSTWKYLSTFIISAINIDLQNKLSNNANNLALTAFPGLAILLSQVDKFSIPL